MKKRTSFYLSISISLLLGGCSSRTPYQPVEASKNNDHGYEEARLAEDLYKVSFKGNDNTKKSTVEALMVQRAAEIAKRNEFPFFRFVQRETDRVVEYERQRVPSASRARATVGSYGGATASYQYAYYSYTPAFNGAYRTKIKKEISYEAHGYVELLRKLPRGPFLNTSLVLANRVD